jgi:hypothetical protein
VDVDGSFLRSTWERRHFLMTSMICD